MSNLLKITDSNFEKEVLQDPGPVLVDMSAEWCGPCKMLAPAIEELASEYIGRIKVGKLDVDDNPNIPTKYNVLSVPTLLFFKNGQLADTQVGLIPKSELKNKIEALL